MRLLVGALVLTVGAGLAGCGDSSDSDDPDDARPAANGGETGAGDAGLDDSAGGGEAGEVDVDPTAACGLLTVDQLGDVYGEPFGEGQPAEDPLGGVTCTWTNGGGDLEVEVVLRPRQRAEAILDAGRQSAEVGGFQDLDGIGDDAFHHPESPEGLPGSEVVIRDGSDVIRARMLLPERLIMQADLSPYYVGIAQAIDDNL